MFPTIPSGIGNKCLLLLRSRIRDIRLPHRSQQALLNVLAKILTRQFNTAFMPHMQFGCEIQIDRFKFFIGTADTARVGPSRLLWCTVSKECH